MTWEFASQSKGKGLHGLVITSLEKVGKKSSYAVRDVLKYIRDVDSNIINEGLRPLECFVTSGYSHKVSEEILYRVIDDLVDEKAVFIHFVDFSAQTSVSKQVFKQHLLHYATQLGTRMQREYVYVECDNVVTMLRHAKNRN